MKSELNSEQAKQHGSALVHHPDEVGPVELGADIGLVSDFFDSVLVNGEDQRVQLSGADSVIVNGSRNSLDVVNGTGTVTLTGADHRIQLPTTSNGVTLVTDDSAGSQIDGNYTEPL